MCFAGESHAFYQEVCTRALFFALGTCIGILVAFVIFLLFDGDIADIDHILPVLSDSEIADFQKKHKWRSSFA